jgi:hypothetical protein
MSWMAKNAAMRPAVDHSDNFLLVAIVADVWYCGKNVQNLGREFESPPGCYGLFTQTGIFSVGCGCCIRHRTKNRIIPIFGCGCRIRH